MITYNDLYEYLRKERYSEQLQNLPKSLMDDVSSYFEGKKQTELKGMDIFSDSVIKTKKQFENAVSLFKELMLRRRKKILNLAFVAAETGISKRDFENMLDFERELFEKIVSGMENAERSINLFLNGNPAKKEDSRNKLVVFKQDTDEFLGIEGEGLGPFKKGELANLNVDIANILLSGEKIEFVDEN